MQKAKCKKANSSGHTKIYQISVPESTHYLLPTKQFSGVTITYLAQIIIRRLRLVKGNRP
jgi:hypothetical protein